MSDRQSDAQQQFIVLYCSPPHPPRPYLRKQADNKRYSASPLALVDAHTQRRTLGKQDGDTVVAERGETSRLSPPHIHCSHPEPMFPTRFAPNPSC